MTYTDAIGIAFDCLLALCSCALHSNWQFVFGSQICASSNHLEIAASWQDILLLKTGNTLEKVEVIRRLGDSKVRIATPHLSAALEDENQHVRAWAAWALGKLKDQQAIDPLINALEKHLKMVKTDIFMDETKCIADMYLALEAITGERNGLDIEKWKAYRATKGKLFER